MHHHSESPEVIRAALAERERGIALHWHQQEAERLLVGNAAPPVANPARWLIGRVRQALQPSLRMHEQPGD